MSKRTVQDYPPEIEKFLAYLEELGVELAETRARDVLDYQQTVLKSSWRGKAPSMSTVHTRMGKVKAFYQYLVESGHMEADPTAHLKLPRRSKTLPRAILSVEEMNRLLNQPDFSPLGLRDRAMMELMYSCGLRSSELRGLMLSQVDLKAKKIRLIGKGNKEAVIPFGEVAAISLGEYISRGRLQLMEGKHGGPHFQGERSGEIPDRLFLSKNGNPINGANLIALVQKHALSAGIEKAVTVHGLRHSCATHLLKGGADIRQIQKLLRHADLSSTQIYTRVEVSDLQELVRKFHPREGRAR